MEFVDIENSAKIKDEMNHMKVHHKMQLKL